MLILSRKVDEKIRIGDEVTITVIGIQGDQVKLGIEAPKNVKVFRQEVFEAIQNENKLAATQNTNTGAVSVLSKLLKK